MKKSAFMRIQIEGGCSVTQVQGWAGFAKCFSPYGWWENCGLDIWLWTSLQGLLPLPAFHVPSPLSEQQDTLQWIFLQGALLGRALHRVAMAVISWELSSISSGKHHTITAWTPDICCPCALGRVIPVAWRAQDQLGCVGWSSENTPGARVVSSGMSFPISALTAGISWPSLRSSCRVHLLSQALKGEEKFWEL